ncbi:MAG: ABC transporter permease subunit, partial [Ardenticatenales bacterium]|nr:ABC transporter permease subunit [Ardenticatenales bacterium]
MTDRAVRPHESVPFWRDVRIIAILLQVAFVIVVGLLFAYLISNVRTNLAQSNLSIGTDFLSQPAGIAISEGPKYASTDSYARAFFVGIANTLRIAIIGIVLATLLGIALGIARLSNNFLLRNVTYVYTELIRNTPLLLQLFLWAGLALLFPRPQEALNLGNFAFLSSRGIFLAWPRATASIGAWTPWLIAALVAAVAVYFWRKRQLAQQDRPGAVLPIALAVAAGVALLGFLVTALTSGAPLTMSFPQLDGFNFSGGTQLTTPFFALLLGLVLYTAAFIGEIIRAGIQAVSKGQREASTALGLTNSQMLRLIILPQALRVIIPPLTNQYLNLTQNSSLA